MEATAAKPAGAEAPALKSNAITFISNLVIGISSTAPGFSLATTVGFIVAIGGIGLQAPALMLVSFIPMFCIAIAYQSMNKVDPDCGTTFSWVTLAMGPHLGWMAGWGLLVADWVVMVTQSNIAATYSLSLFGLDPGNVAAVIAIGVGWIVLMTAICYIGIELSARTQQFLLGAEIVTLVIFAVVALVKVYTQSPPSSMHVSASWFNPFEISSPSALLDGLLLGVFLYWGWDSGVSVNEETVDGAEAPGRAAVLSTILLLLIYLVVTASAQAYAGEKALVDNADDIFAGGLGNAVLGDGLDKLLIIAVLTSSAAATQTTILPAARSALSMARRKAIPPYFGEVHHKHLTPGHSTMIFGAASIPLFVGLKLWSDDVIADSLAACGFLVCFYYGFTGFACAIYFRKQIFKSGSNFFRFGFLPVFGALTLTAVFVKCFVYYSDPENSSSGQAVFGLGLPLFIGLGALGLGVVALIYANLRHRDFFRDNSPQVAEPESV
jgi:amino acid transporter